MKLPNSWVEVRLDEICTLNPRLPIADRPDESTSVSFFPMSAVDELSGTVTKPEVRTSGEVAKGYTSFRERDVLFAKVTPCMENGKAAIAGKLMNDLGFGSTEFHVLRPNTMAVLPEYLFHFIRQQTFRNRAASAFVGTGGLQRVPPEFLRRVKLPLPTIPEQHRIVDVLQQASAVGSRRTKTEDTIQSLAREHYANLFGDVLRNDKGWPLRKIGNFSELVRGSSPRPQGDPRLFGGPVPRLMVSDLTRDGLWVNATTDSLTVEGAKASRPMPALSVVMAVSGAPGMTAILNHDACIHDGFVGLRDLDAGLLPEFVAFTLNLLRAKNDQQAVGAVFRNLTSDQVKAIAISVPPLDLQKLFRTFLLQVQAIRRDIAKSTEILRQLSLALTVDAFSGDATANWRGRHQAEIAAAVEARDTLLRQSGAKLTNRAPEPAPTTPTPTTPHRPARQWLMGELSDFQREVLTAFSAYPDQPLLAEDADVFTRFCDEPDVAARLAAFDASPNHIRRTLSQLAALGLIAKLTLPKLNPATGERDYLKAFRPLRGDENTQAADVTAMRRALDGPAPGTAAEGSA